MFTKTTNKDVLADLHYAVQPMIELMQLPAGPDRIWIERSEVVAWEELRVGREVQVLEGYTPVRCYLRNGGMFDGIVPSAYVGGGSAYRVGG